MDEKWKKWLFGSLIAVLGGVVAYLTPLTSPEQVVGKAIIWIVIQKLIAALATLPAGTAVKGGPSGAKKWLSRL